VHGRELEATAEVTLSFRVGYMTSGFSPGVVTRIGELSFGGSELVHGLFTAGRAPGDQLIYGDASVWELLHRASLVRAYIRSNYDQRLTLSRLAWDLDRSERAAVLYAIGQAMTCIFSRQVLSMQYLMHIERYASRWAIDFGNRKRPDLFGRSPQGWIVAEAKGRSSTPDTPLRTRIREQKSSVTSIQGQKPALAIGCISYFSSQEPWLRMDVIDPKFDSEGIELGVDADRFILTYYEPFLMAVDMGRDSEERQSLRVPSDDDVVSVQFGSFDLRIGLLRSIDALVRQAKSSGDLTGLSQTVARILESDGRGSLFPDGTLVEAQWDDSISTADWLY
jgi:hypothetical protein